MKDMAQKVASTVIVIVGFPAVSVFLGVNFAGIALYQIWRD